MTRPVVRRWEYDRLAFNLQAGNDSDDVERNLRALIAAAAAILGHHPHIIVLSEARPYAGLIARVARDLGYERFQARPRQLSARQRRRKVQEEDANLATLVRLDVGTVTARRWRMRRTWRGPINGWPHLPRLYWQIVLAIPGAGVWRDAAMHAPTPKPVGNARAVNESISKLGRYLRAGKATPSVAGGDLNAGAAELRERLPDLRVVAGHGADNVVTNQLVESEVHVLGKYGSNHHAVLTRHRRTD
ncbi:hypothetical protein [Nocardioides sp. LML1-1-1.1]|uniref:hypothetical protein n=1 Tax=Nocardioides sp. LML1-1-1.1 TaxID=3135248 RepID=UPI00343514E0